jgi:membrane fusion protein (multidrug efflux system)
MTLRAAIRRLVMLAALVAVVAGCGSGEKDSGDAAGVRIPVVTQPVVRGDVDFTVTTLGTVEAWKEVVVSAKTSGQILELNFEKGDAVRPKPADDANADETAARPLAVLEQQEYKLRWLEAEAALADARSTYERTKRLFEQGSAVQSDFDTAKSLFDVAQARRDLARKQYDDTVIYSPIAGIVVAKPAEAGEFVAPGTPLATVADIARVKIVTSVSESDSPHVAVGETYPLRVDAFPGRAFEGRAIYKSVKADVATRSFPVELELDNADGALGIGMVARVTFTLRTEHDAICVPLDSLVYWENRLGVFVIEQDDTAAFRALTLGERQGDDVLVADGLAGGEQLVVVGQDSLQPGRKVTTQSEAPPASPESAEQPVGPENAW